MCDAWCVCVNTAWPFICVVGRLVGWLSAIKVLLAVKLANFSVIVLANATLFIVVENLNLVGGETVSNLD